MRCILLCLVSGNVSGFFSSDRDFFLVFKYVKLYICFLRRRLLNLSFSTGYKKNGVPFFTYRGHFFYTNSIYYIFNFLDENVSVFFI